MNSSPTAPFLLQTLTSFTNPRPPLVRYVIPPVFPPMSPQESRVLWCIMESDPKPYDVFVPIDAYVNQLKAAIQQRIKTLHGVDPDRLELRKVVSLIPGACAF